MAVHKFSYNYTKLNEIPEDGRVYVYGVVKSIVDSDFGGPIIEIQDENASVIVKVAKKSRKYFEDLKTDDILRLHRVEVGSYGDSPALIVDINNCGCHALSWRGTSDIPYFATSKTYTLTSDAIARLASLRKLFEINGSDAAAGPSVEPIEVADVHQAEEVATVHEAEEGQPTSSDAVDDQEAAVLATPTAHKTPTRSSGTISAKQRRPFNEITNAADIPELSNKFFNWYAQVLGVYKGKGEPFTVFLRVWDGSRPRFPAYRNMFRADNNSIETTYCDIPANIFAAIEPCVIDVCCYGEYARKAMNLQIKDIVYLCNIRNYMSQSNLISAITLHEGGSQFGRALRVVDPSDSKHFEVSKSCADALTRVLGSRNLPLSSSSAVNLTPITPENVLAQSTPVLTKDSSVNATTSKNCNGDDFSSESSSGSSDELEIEEQSNEQGTKENVRTLAPDTGEESIQQLRISSGEEDEGERALMIVDDSDDLDLEPGETGRTIRQSDAFVHVQASPSPKRARMEISSTNAGFELQGLNDAADVGQQQSESLHFSELSTQRIVEASTPKKRTLAALEQATSAGSSGVRRSPRKRLTLAVEQENHQAGKSYEEVHIGESPKEQRQSAITMQDSCTASFLAALERDDFTAESVSNDLAKQIALSFLSSDRHRMLMESRHLKEATYTLAEEIEEMLKLSEGDCVGFINFAHASISLMQQDEYLRHAVVFTAKCIECGDEVVVERCKNTYCVKCFTERSQLAQTVCSCRIPIPVEYKRTDGSAAQLLLLVPREIWAALPSQSNLFSVEQVNELHRETNMHNYLILLNDVIRFVAAVVNSRKIYVSEARIFSLCRLTGSLTLFVRSARFI